MGKIAQLDGCVLQCHAIRSAWAVRSEQPTFMRTPELSAATSSPIPPPGPPQAPSEVSDGLFQLGRRLAGAHPLLTDSVLAAALLLLSTWWLAGSRFSGTQAALLQVALIAPLAARRAYPSAVFTVISLVAFAQWLFAHPLIGDVALLVALYTVAAHQSRARAVAAAALLEAGAVMASLTWTPAGSVLRSLVFLSATVVAALFAGLTVASGRRYLDWMEERARRLEVEKEHEAAIATAAERARIARELHDIVSHTLSVVITMADAAALVSRTDPERGGEAMAEVSELGRSALSDMRAMLGLLRAEEPAELVPPPGAAQFGGLIERVRSTGLDVQLSVDGDPFALGAAGELTIYRIVQEALTNTLRHACARHVWVSLSYSAPEVRLGVTDDGRGATPGGRAGHGLDGMRERAALYGGELLAGPLPQGGWSVSTTMHLGRADVATPVPR